MKSFKKFTAFFILILAITISFKVDISFFSNKRDPAAQSETSVEYAILGTNTLLGDYAGRAQIKNGKIIRKIHFSTYRFHGNEVESIWSGKLNGDTFEFTLALSNLLTRFENYAPDESAFQTPVKVSVPKTITDSDVSFSLPEEGGYIEHWTRLDSVTGEPIWTEDRKTEEGVGTPSPLFASVAKLIGINKVIDMYRNLPQVKQYTDRKEFREAKQYYIQDRTDADFYLNNPSILRIANKTVNPLALAEAEMKRNAYGKSLKSKADFLYEQTVRNNLNSAGLLEVAIVDSEGRKTGRAPEGDSALWSSMFGQAEILRYQVTKDPKSLENFKRVLKGELTLVEITGDPSQFARTLIESPAEENLGERWIQGTGKFSHLKWQTGGNNDMIKGVFTTLILAHQVKNELDSETIERIQSAAKRLHLLSPAVSGFNNGIAKGLDALWNKNEESFNTFASTMLNVAVYLGDVTHIGIGFYFGGITDWSGVNLTMTSTMCQLLLSKELQKVFPYNPVGYKAGQSLAVAEHRLKEMHRIYKIAHRDFIALMTYANVQKAKRNENFVKVAQDAVWALREVPAPRTIGLAEANLKFHPHWSLSAWPRLPWKVMKGVGKIKENPNLAGLLEGAYAYPQYEANILDSTYIWKDNPFDTYYKSEPHIQSFSADYLMMYWTSRASGLISEND